MNQGSQSISNQKLRGEEGELLGVHFYQLHVEMENCHLYSPIDSKLVGECVI